MRAGASHLTGRTSAFVIRQHLGHQPVSLSQVSRSVSGRTRGGLHKANRDAWESGVALSRYLERLGWVSWTPRVYQ
jgi:hypothetical protein